MNCTVDLLIGRFKNETITYQYENQDINCPNIISNITNTNSSVIIFLKTMSDNEIPTNISKIIYPTSSKGEGQGEGYLCRKTTHLYNNCTVLFVLQLQYPLKKYYQTAHTSNRYLLTKPGEDCALRNTYVLPN